MTTKNISLVIRRLVLAFSFLFVGLGCSGDRGTEIRFDRPKKTIIEPFVLTDMESKKITYAVDEIISVSVYDHSGRLLSYEMDQIRFDTSSNSLSRSDASLLPNFRDYPVILDENGFFSFSYGPRNPPVIIPYTVYIEYTTYGNDCDVKTSSDKLKFYDLYDDYINVFVFGDSIAAGAHTPSQYFYGFDNDSFSGLLRNTFIDLGIAGEVNNLAINGGTTSFMSNNYHDAIYSDADVVIIELGMNDHINGLSPGSADQFRDDISEVVSNLLSENIDVILIGFFQQNELWVMEKSTETLVYNEILNKIAADYEIPFVDIRSEFISLDHKGIEDLTGDWMHHPNDFGHKVYYSQLVPYLFDEKQLGDITLNDFLCIQ